MNLNIRQLKFAQAYATDGHAERAAIAAGYKASSAKVTASRLLTNVDVQAEIMRCHKELHERTGVDAAWLLTELADLALMDPLEIFDERGDLRELKDMSVRARKSIAGLEVEARYDDDGNLIGHVRKIKLLSRLRVLELVGKHTAVRAFGPDTQINMPVLVVRDYTRPGEQIETIEGEVLSGGAQGQQ